MKSPGTNHPPSRKLRRDAAANRDRLLVAAATAIRREGAAVPLATIAREAGVGVGTLYRSYSSRDALLAALTHRSFEIVLGLARTAGASEGVGIDRLRLFVEQVIEHGQDFVLPLHGGPTPLNPDTVEMRTQVHDTIGEILRLGGRDGSIRPDVSAFDIIVFGALLAQPLPSLPSWREIARREAAIYFDGLASNK